MSDITSRRSLPDGRASRTRAVLIATGILVVGITPFAVAATGDPLRQGLRNGTTTAETEIISNIASTNALKGGYSTRQSNLSSTGGGAIYGCRSQAGGSTAKPVPQNPCLRANNLSRGLAFEMRASQGNLGGTISVANGGDTTKPFTTNATGVANGLNADRVDGKNAEDIGKDAIAAIAVLRPFALVPATGSSAKTRGVVTTNGVTNPSGAGTYVVTFDGDLSECAMSTTLTGTTPGQISVNPTLAADKKTTGVDVRTFNGTGVAADRGFHLSAIC